MAEPLPAFRYHPDPLATGSIAPSEATCQCCGQVRGYVYTGQPYARAEIEFLCPWCIADGSAAEAFDATFTTTDRAADDVPPAVLDEVERRTPGFSGWQEERWMFHCGDAAEFHGPVSWEDVEQLPSAVEALLADEWPAEFLPNMSVDGDLTGYLFRCRHCGTHLAYADIS
jgi:uncharacterized protein CbrC (UPF0167 family)